MGEFDLIRRYFASDARALPEVPLGIGDDCALIDAGGTLAVSTDMLVQGRHFFADVDPEALGHKALAVNLSDLAAMGARPIAFVLALALPVERARDDDWMTRFARGLHTLAQRSACALVGGDTTAGPLNVCITVFGRVDAHRALRRSGARVGDDVWVSGALGAAAAAVEAIASGRAPAPDARRALEWPTPRLALGQALLGCASSAIDLSDGLAGDLRHLTDASGVGAEIALDALPYAPSLQAFDAPERERYAVAGGDDYELCFTAPVARRGDVEAAGRATQTDVTRIGRIVSGAAIHWHRGGAPVAGGWRGYDHFASRQ